jgi:membrane peptidoglycan carboxypeptidase
MIARIRSRHAAPRLRIPRKGRIRVVLALVLVSVVAVAVGRLPARPKPALQKKPDVRVAEIREQKKPKHSLWTGFSLVSLDKKFNETNVALMLREHPPRLNGIDDTVIDGGRFAVHYSLDSALQNLSQRLLQQYQPKYGAVVALEPQTGRVVALYSYSNPAEAPIPDLWRKSIFPAASIFKTITAAAAIDAGKLNTESCLDLAGRRHTLYRFQIAPKLSYASEITLKEAYAHSVNPVFARIGMYLVGYRELQASARKFGFGAAVPFELEVDSSSVMSCDSAYDIAELASGFNKKTTLSPLLGALIAASVVENGRMPRPTLVDSVSDLGDSRTVYRAVPMLWKIPIKETTARQLRVMMCDVAEYGTARHSFRYIKRSARFDTLEYGGKTGSIDKENAGRVDWFIGFIRHRTDPRQQLAVGIVTVHGAYWTVHSSFIGEELMRVCIRAIQTGEKDREPIIVNADSVDAAEGEAAGGG